MQCSAWLEGDLSVNVIGAAIHEYMSQLGSLYFFAICYCAFICVLRLQEDSEKEDSGEEDADGQHAKKAKTDADGGGVAKPMKIWFERDVKIAEAFAAQKDWQSTMDKTLKDLHTEGVTMTKEHCHSN